MSRMYKVTPQADEAAATVQIAISADPSFTSARVNLAVAFSNSRRLDDAARAIGGALEGEPTARDIHLNRFQM